MRATLAGAQFIGEFYPVKAGFPSTFLMVIASVPAGAW